MKIYNSPEEQHIIVLRNIVKMLISRNFLDIKMKDHYFKKIMNKLKSDSITFVSDNSDTKINLKFLNSQNIINKQTIFKSINKDEHYIFVLESVKLERTLKDYKRLPYIEIFQYNEFYLNIIDNILVPQHSLLSEDEKEELLTTLNCTLDQIPIIYNSDRIVRHYNFPIDSICKIERINETTGKTITYRRVMLIFE